MRLTAIILLTSCLAASASGHTQNISINEKQASLQKIFKEINRQAGYQFFYKDELLDKAGKVDVVAKNLSIEQVLNICFKNLNISYTIVDKTIIVKEKIPNAGRSVTPVTDRESIPEMDITGRVTDPDGNPLAGASVKVKGTSIGTTTSGNGEFFLKGISDDAELIISFVGYKLQTVKVDGRKNITIGLALSENKLDETVVIGYGATTKRFNTGSISKVTSEDIERQPVGNILNALQGLVPGLDIVQTTGYASGQYNVTVRGRKNLFSVPSNPLIILDGVPLPTSNGDVNNLGLNQNGIFGQNGGQNPFFGINPADIESIEVLKDADATSIYGSRGANGVILITTKRGKPGSATLQVNFYTGVTAPPKKVDLLNTSQYLAMRREAFKNNNIVPDIFNAPDLLQWDTTSYTDWQKELSSSTWTTDGQLSFSGGNANTNFRINGGYHKEGIPVPEHLAANNFKNERYSAQFALNHTSTNRKLNVATILGYTTTNEVAPGSFYRYDLPPNAPAILDSTGHLNWTQWGNNMPYEITSLFHPYKAYTTNLNGNITLSYNFFKGFNATVSVGYTNTNMDQLAKYPASSQSQNPQFGYSQAQYGINHIRSWIVEPHATYTTRFGKGTLQAMAGSTLTESITKGENISGGGYVNENLIGNMGSAATIYAINNYAQYRFQGYFTRLNYNWDQKYILNLSGRIDGSSRFKPGDQFGTFGSAGAAWLFQEEKFIKDHLHFLSFGKLRGSYGTTGSPAANDYRYLEFWQSAGTYGGNTALTLTQPYNPGFQWQVNKKLDAGIELGFLNDRIFLTADWYRERTGNQLVFYPLPAFTGLFPIVQNLPAEVQNKGWEFLLRTINLQSKNFTWMTSFNISLNRNKLLSFPNLELTNYANNYKVGEPLSIQKVYHFTGVDPQTGLYIVEDIDKNGSITDDDRSVTLDLTPSFTGGFQNTIEFKSWQLSLFMDFKKQRGPYSISNDAVPGSLVNQPASVLNRWQKPGDATDVGMFAIYSGNDYFYYTASDARIVNASFLRLQNVSLSYSLPAKVINRVKIAGFKVYLQGQNLLIFSPYKGINPINPALSSSNFPPQRNFTAGIQLTF